MTPLRNAVRLFALPFLLTSALSASTDFRILFDTDNNPATGCTVAGMNGVERVVTTTLDTSGSTPRVSLVQFQSCSGGSLGAPVALEIQGWPAGFDATSGVYTVETRVLYSVFGDPVPTRMRLGFVAVSGSQTATILTDDDGNPFLFPQPPVRRRIVGTPGHTFVLDGLIGDWMAMPPLSFGDAGNGPNLARFLAIFAGAGADGFYFRFDFQSHSGAPTARNDSYSTPAGTPLSVTAPGVMSNDSDPNNRALTSALVSSVMRGALALNADGSFIYTPADGGTFRDTFRYRVSNGSQPSNVARVEIHVGRSNHPPNAGDDTYNVVKGGTITAAAPGVLGNDNDPDGDALHAVLRSSPTHGTLTFNSDGSFTYVNDGVSTTNDSFTYVANDGQDDSREATVHINVTTNPNAPPHANADAYSVNEGGTLNVPAPGVLTNDTDPDTPANALSVFRVQQPLHGTVTLNANGSFIYVHDGSDTTSDTFTYRAFDGMSQSNVAVVTITITPVNDAPIALNDAYTTLEDTSLTVPAPGVLANDTDSDTPAVPLTALIATNPTNGNVVLNANGSFTYTPNANFFGTDSFTYRASDGPAQSALATVTITITQVNDPPSFIVGGNVTVLEDSGAYSAPQASAISPGPGETEAVSFGVTNNNNALFGAQPAISPAGVLTFTPAPNANGTATVTVILTDTGTPPLSAPPQTFTINVTPVNDVPSFTKGPDELVLDTAGAQTFAGWALSLSAGPPNEAAQLLNFIVSNDNNALFSAQPSIAPNGTLTFTPAAGQKGVANVTVQIHDNGGTANGGVDTSVAQTFKITVDQAPAITSGNAHTFIIGVFSSFTVTTTGFPAPAITKSGALPAGITLVDNGNGTATLSGTAAAGTGGTYPITIAANNGVGVPATQPFTITVTCPTIIVTNPATSTAPVASPFSRTFTQSGGVGAMTFTTASPLPAGLALAANGTLSGTPTQIGTFPITVTATDSNGCTGTGPTYNLVITCQTITVTNPAVTTGTISAPFSRTFTQTGAIGATTFTTVSALPGGLTLATNGTLSGTPTVTGTFPIVVKVTDSNGCTGTGPTYNLIIGCQTITVTNPATTTGTAGTAFSQPFTQTGAIGATTFALASGTLPTGLTLSAGGVLSGTPTQGGTFPITVMVTDANGCPGTGPTYNLLITCPTITVTNPVTTTGTAGTPFSQNFTQSGGQGTITFTVLSGTLPAGLTLATNGTLSGAPTQTGTFPITVRATDQNGCIGNGPTYTLVISCQTFTVTNPVVTSGIAGSPFSQTFTQSGAIGGATFTLNTGSLPTGLSLSTGGVLSGTPLQTGSFPITVKVTDGNGCTGIGAAYTLVISCQTITVTNPATTTGTILVPFSQTFTQTSAIGGAAFSLNSGSLPAGLLLSAAGVLSGTPTVTGSFPITVKVTDGNGCSGIGATYNLVINCQTITVTNPATTTGTVNAPFSQLFTQTGANGAATFTTASTLPAGLSLATNGTLSGTANQSGTFPIVVTVTDSNGCTGTSPTYTLIISCQTIIVTNPATTTATVGTPFSQTFTQTGGVGTTTFSESGALPTGLTFHTATGILDGTPTQSGTFPITVTATDSNGCTGTGPTYSLVLTCNVLTVTNPATSTGTAGVAFSQTFTQTGGNGTITWSKTGALPAGITLNSATGVLSGTTSITGSFPITVTATDVNGCSGTGPTYTLVINCQTITVTNPVVNTGIAGTAFSQTFTAAGILGTVSWSETGALPTGITLNPATGVLSGTTTQIGSFPITVKATDTNGCFGTGSTYTLTINCQTITVTNPGTSAATFNVLFSRTFTATNILGTATWSETGTLPTGITLNSSTGVLSGTPTQTGTFPITVTATDTNLCFGTGSTYTLTVAPVANNDSYNNLVDNTQAVVTGGATASPGTPFVGLSGAIIANDLPAGGVTATAGIFATAAAGSVTIATDGTFIYTPKANSGGAATTSDSFTYTVSSNTGGVSPVTSAPATVNLALANRVWYVRNNAGGGGNGQSQAPFNTLAAAGTASTANDFIFVYNGDGTNTNQNAGISLKSGQRLWGEAVQLNVGPNILVLAGSRPTIGNSGGAGVTVDATTGSLTNVIIRGVAVAGTTQAINIFSGAANTLFASVDRVVVNSAGNNGIRISGGSSLTSTVNVQLSTINAATQNGIDAQQTVPGNLVLDIDNNTIAAAGTGININGAGSTSTTITNFANNVIGAGTANGISVNASTFDATPGGAFQTVSGGITAIGPVGLSGMVLTTVSGDLSFTDLDIVANNGAGLRATSGTPYTGSAGFQIAVGAGVANVTATGGPAVDLATVTANLPFQSITSTNSATTGTSLDTVLGTFSAGASSAITNATGTDFNINLGTASVTYNGTITDTTGRLVSVTNTIGGTKSFTGAISDSAGGSGTGIFLNANTPATITFSGGISLSTGGNAAFTATGGGTVTATQNNTSVVNTLTTTTGTALNVTSTTIGAGGLTFRSITSNGSGSANGIILDTTGTIGSLTVTGNGGSCTSPGTCTGGTISNKTGPDGSTTQGSGIFLNQTSNPSFTRMQLNDFQNFAIRGTNVTGFTLDNSNISGTNGTNSAGGSREGDIAFDGLFTSATFPTAQITNSTLGGTSFSDILRVFNTGGTLNRLTVSNTTFGTVGISGNDAMVAVAFNNGTVLNVTLQDSVLTNAIGSTFRANANNNSLVDIVVRRNKFSNNNPNFSSGGGLLSFQGGGAATNATMTYDISCNSFRDAIGIAVLVAMNGGSGTSTGDIINNSVGVTGVSLSGSTQASGIKLAISGSSGTHTTMIQNNVVRQTNEEGIFIQNNNGTATLNASVFGNLVAEPGAFQFAGLNVDIGAGVAGDTSKVNVVIGSAGTASLKNDFSNGDPFDFSDVNLSLNTQPGGFLNLSTNGSGSGTAAQVIKDDNLNPATTNTGVSGTVTLVGTLPATPPAVATCTIPP